MSSCLRNETPLLSDVSLPTLTSNPRHRTIGRTHALWTDAFLLRLVFHPCQTKAAAPLPWLCTVSDTVSVSLYVYRRRITFLEQPARVHRMITGQPGSRSSLPSHRTLARRWVQYDPQPIPNVASRPIWSWMAQGPFFALPQAQRSPKCDVMRGKTG